MEDDLILSPEELGEFSPEELEERSPEELEEIRKQIRENAFNGKKIKGWIWNEEKISYVPPIDPPDNRPYLWNEDTESWDLFPDYSEDL